LFKLRHPYLKSFAVARYGRLYYHGGFVNLRNGRTTSLPTDPAVWQRMINDKTVHGAKAKRKQAHTI